MLLFFDTETTGLVNNREPPDHPSQPHLVELGMVLCDDVGVERASASLIVRPDGYEIPAAAANVHGITTSVALVAGVPLVVAMALFSNFVKVSQAQVAHNTDFDQKIIYAAFARLGRPLPALNPKCTKNLAEPVLKLPPTERMIAAGFGHKHKAPTLTECVKFLFDEDLVGAHGALVDTRACARVYFELMRRLS